MTFADAITETTGDASVKSMTVWDAFSNSDGSWFTSYLGYNLGTYKVSDDLTTPLSQGDVVEVTEEGGTYVATRLLAQDAVSNRELSEYARLPFDVNDYANSASGGQVTWWDGIGGFPPAYVLTRTGDGQITTPHDRAAVGRVGDQEVTTTIYYGRGTISAYLKRAQLLRLLPVELWPGPMRLDFLDTPYPTEGVENIIETVDPVRTSYDGPESVNLYGLSDTAATAFAYGDMGAIRLRPSSDPTYIGGTQKVWHYAVGTLGSLSLTDHFAQER